MYALSRVSIVRGCRARQCSLLCLANWYHVAARGRTNTAARVLGACQAKSERFFVPRQRDFSVLCSFSWDCLVSEEQRPSTAARELGACRAKSERFFVPRQRDFSVLCSFSWDGLVSEEQRPSTATRGCRAQSIPSLSVTTVRSRNRIAN
jgi:hypothetical protein